MIGRRSLKVSAFSILGLVAALSAPAASYHVDSASGNDASDGLAPERAWRSVERVNAATFQPGDRILLRAGSVWTDATLAPHGSGTPAASIVIDRYGPGATPVLNGRGQVPCVLKIENQEYWEISHLEITNHTDKAGARLRGIELRAADSGVRHHLHFTDLFIHDVNGAATYTNDADTAAKSYGGFVTLIEGTATPTRWDDLLVERCRFTDDGPAGLTMFSSWVTGHAANDPTTWIPSRGVVVRGCTFERIARNGLVVRACSAPLIEHNLFTHCGLLGSGNACFAFHCDDALFQFNEACYTKYNPGDADAAGFDSDYNCRRTVFQYNYSHDNDYGFILLCCNGQGGFNDGTIVRHNVSQNDGGVTIRFAGPVKNTLIEHNTVYARAGMKNPREKDPPRLVLHKSWSGWSDGVVMRDNVIVNLNPDAGYDFGKSTNNRYAHNLFFGAHPASEPDDAEKLTGDPLLKNPGGASVQNETADAGYASARAAYVLRSGSPAAGLGADLPPLR